MKEELLILGNGFDLNAGLRSSYQNFLDTDEAKNSDNLWIEILSKGSDLHVQGANWSDVESVIEAILITCSEELIHYLIYQVLENEIQEVRNYIKDNTYKVGLHRSKSESGTVYDDETEHLVSSVSKAQTKMNLYEQIQYNLSTQYVLVSYMSFDPKLTEVEKKHNFNDNIAKFIVNNKNHITDLILEQITPEAWDSSEMKLHSELITIISPIFDLLLLKELNNFEVLFTDYLKTLVTDNISYLEKSKKTFNSILRTSSPTDVNIVSFNYTNPFENDLVFGEDDKIINNVHGTLGQKNIIFGIDLTKRFKKKKQNVPPRLIPFTKTFRKMSINTPDNWLLPKNPVHIRVYGHSLSSSDYSYFQSIFDYIDLYDSNVILEFCFSVFGGYETGDYTNEMRIRLEDEARTSIKNTQQINAYNLINEYGSTLNNKDQGNNLLHKLLLENRLKIREIPKLS